MTRRPLLSAIALLSVLTLMITWPMALHLTTRVPGHDDPLFSMWRLGWIAHALRTGQPLFDANIYYPHARTLAYSDAMLLEGVIAAPLLWAQLNPVLVYNVMFLGAIISSGAAMFVLVRYLTTDIGAALVAATIFTLAPYRIEHYIHLELQWTMWMPLTLWALHRCFDESGRADADHARAGTWRWGLLTGLFLWLQLISCVYYGAFLAVIVSALALLLFATRPADRRRALGPLCCGALLATALTLPYALPYLAATRELGARPEGEVLLFSAEWRSYLTAPYQNWIWGWTAWAYSGNERHLLPGIVPVVIAAFGLARKPRRLPLIYFAIAALAVVLSLGLNGMLYRWLYEHTFAFRGFRAPARFAILACCAMSVLAGFGYQVMMRLLATESARRALLIAMLVAIGVESGSAPLALAAQPTKLPPIYQFLQTLPPSVIIEFPFDNYDPTYMFWSTYHWHSLINGYSGYTPPDDVETKWMMDTFPDEESMKRLKTLKTKYVLVHQAFYKPAEYAELMDAIARRAELVPAGRYRDWVGGETQIFELR
jgi:hypothetical protein